MTARVISELYHNPKWKLIVTYLSSVCDYTSYLSITSIITDYIIMDYMKNCYQLIIAIKISKK